MGEAPMPGGFTLIELLLAMAISAALAATIYMALSTAFRAKQTAEAAALPTSAGSIAMDLVCHDLNCIVPPPPANPASDSTGNTPLTLSVPFEGTHQGGSGVSGIGAGNGNGGGSAGGGDVGSDDLQFSTVDHDEPVDPNDPLSEGIRTVEFLIRTDMNPPALVRRVTRNVLTTNQNDYQDEILCRNVRGFTCKYFDGSQWQTDWDSTQYASQYGDAYALPMAVSVEIDIDDPRANVRPGEQRPVRAVTRIVPIPCAKQTPPDTTLQ
jgi:prepilin-type N-terminal cleavage/methylation domain-containing protein